MPRTGTLQIWLQESEKCSQKVKGSSSFLSLSKYFKTIKMYFPEDIFLKIISLEKKHVKQTSRLLAVPFWLGFYSILYREEKQCVICAQCLTLKMIVERD